MIHSGVVLLVESVQYSVRWFPARVTAMGGTESLYQWRCEVAQAGESLPDIAPDAVWGVLGYEDGKALKWLCALAFEDVGAARPAAGILEDQRAPGGQWGVAVGHDTGLLV